eukprot:COSAG02_NODE_11040_length_1806_cov_4.816052_2_plen_246_part_00
MVLKMSDTAALGERLFTGNYTKGLYFSVRCEGTDEVVLHALCIPGEGGGWHVQLYLKMSDTADWGPPTRQEGGESGRVTRVPLSPPVRVGAGKTVDFYLRATKGRVMLCNSEAALGTVDATDGVLSVLMGGKQDTFAGLFGQCYDYPHSCAAPPGFIEYEVAAVQAPAPSGGALIAEEGKVASVEPAGSKGDYNARRAELLKARREFEQQKAAAEAAAKQKWTGGPTARKVALDDVDAVRTCTPI